MYTEIHRVNKVEAVKALCGLVERGWSVTVPLQRKTSSITENGSYNRRSGRYESKHTLVTSCWYCKLKAPRRDEPT